MPVTYTNVIKGVHLFEWYSINERDVLYSPLKHNWIAMKRL